MKVRIEISDKDRYIRSSNDKDYDDNSDFYRRWYAKFGDPQTRTLPGDVFMKRLKEMIEFE